MLASCVDSLFSLFLVQEEAEYLQQLEQQDIDDMVEGYFTAGMLKISIRLLVTHFIILDYIEKRRPS